MYLIQLEEEILEYFKQKLSYSVLVRKMSNRRYMAIALLEILLPYVTFCGLVYFITNNCNGFWTFGVSVLAVLLFMLYLAKWGGIQDNRNQSWLKQQNTTDPSKSFKDYFLECQIAGLRNYLSKHDVSQRQLTILIRRLEKKKKEQTVRILFVFLFLSALVGFTNEDLQVISRSLFKNDAERSGAVLHFFVMWLGGMAILPFALQVKDLSYGNWLWNDRIIRLLKEIELSNREKDL